MINAYKMLASKQRASSFSPISPIGLALFSYFIFFACTLIPTKTYENVMLEPNLMFLDPLLHIFVISCVGSFVFGVLLVQKGGGNKLLAVRSPQLSRFQICIPILLAIGLNLISVLVFLRNNPTLLMAWLDDATAVKKEFDSTDGFSEALPLLFGMCWWGLWSVLHRESFSGKKDWILRLILASGFFFAVGTALVKVARYDLMPGIFGLAIVFIAYRFRNANVPLRRYFAPLLKMVIVIVFVFVALSWLRGNDESSTLLRSIFGYTAASYNRLAAMLSGDLSFPYGGTGTYAFRFLARLPLLSRWVDLQSTFGMPAPEDAFLSEFPAVSQAGLDGSYIWASAFGYLYSDIGYFALPYLFVVGVFSAILWRGLKRGTPASILLYPWFAFSIFCWFGDNFIAYRRLPTLIFVAIALTFYQKMLKSRVGFRSKRGFSRV